MGEVTNPYLLPHRPSLPSHDPPGVLGPAMIRAESVESGGEADELSCTPEVQRLYLAATFRFEAKAQPQPTAPGGDGGDSPAVLIVKRPAAAGRR